MQRTAFKKCLGIRYQIYSFHSFNISGSVSLPRTRWSVSRKGDKLFRDFFSLWLNFRSPCRDLCLSLKLGHNFLVKRVGLNGGSLVFWESKSPLNSLIDNFPTLTTHFLYKKVAIIPNTTHPMIIPTMKMINCASLRGIQMISWFLLIFICFLFLFAEIIKSVGVNLSNKKF